LRSLIQKWDILDKRKYGKKLQSCYNQWLINQKGCIYVSPWSTAHRHNAYHIKTQSWIDPKWVEELLEYLRNKSSQLPSLNGDKLSCAVRNWLELRNLFVGWVIGLKDEFNTSSLPDGLSDLYGISSLQLSILGKATISSMELKAILNLMQSEIAHLRYGLLRPQVLVRTKFSLTKINEIFYVFKPDYTWSIPTRYYEKYPATREIFDNVTSLTSDNLVAQASRILRSNDAVPLLKQMPHDWWLAWEIQGANQKKLKGFEHKGKLEEIYLPNKLTEKKVLGRLIGSPAYKGALEKILTSEAQIGDLTLIIDFIFKQKLLYKMDAGFSLQQEQVGQKLTLALPLTECNGEETLSNKDFFDHIIAFDQGERFISYAVFDLRDYLVNGNMNPQTDLHGNAFVGKIAIPSSLHLRQKVNQNRRKQPTQKITDRYNRAMEKRREAAVGEISQRIERLCQKYSAFPVLESQLDGFERGSNQLKVVYGSLLHLYTLSKVDAHKSARTHHWFGGDNWSHPYLWRNRDEYETAENGKKKKVGAISKMLTTFPGVTVHPASTSKECVFCNRDPIKSLYEYFENNEKIKLNNNGECDVKDGRLQIMDLSNVIDKKTKRAMYLKNSNPRAKLNCPLAHGEYDRNKILRYARATLRQQSLFLNQKDTTQSRYQCLYTNCAKTYHADEGAAINIGRKFLKSIDIKKSKENLNNVY
jgi:hypothetical protein